MSLQTDIARAVARHHCAWAERAGMHPSEILRALGEPLPRQVGWDYVSGRLAVHWLLLSAQHRLGLDMGLQLDEAAE